MERIDFSGKIESQFLFRTALSKSILPFALFKPDLVVLPITIEINTYGKKEIKLHSSNELMKQGFLNASKWFENSERIWDLQKTAKSKNMSANDRIDFQRGLTGQNLNFKYIILYNALGKDANATVITRGYFDLELFADYKSYVFYTNFSEEAYYLTAILNSTAPNERIKDFQARGLFGARGVEKKILDIYFPKYDETNDIHQKLATLSQTAHEKAATYLAANPPQQELSAIYLGRLRGEIKKHLSNEIKEIDKLVKKVMAS